MASNVMCATDASVRGAGVASGIPQTLGGCSRLCFCNQLFFHSFCSNFQDPQNLHTFVPHFVSSYYVLLSFLPFFFSFSQQGPARDKLALQTTQGKPASRRPAEKFHGERDAKDAKERPRVSEGPVTALYDKIGPFCFSNDTSTKN